MATLPVVTPASPLQPIEGRVVMLQSGIKGSMAIRVHGDRLDELAQASLAVADQLKKLPYVNARTLNPDIVLGKPYVEFTVDPSAAARYGMTVEAVNPIVESALGGMNLIATVKWRERYPVRILYATVEAGRRPNRACLMTTATTVLESQRILPFNYHLPRPPAFHDRPKTL